MEGLRLPELMIILAIAAVLFGGPRLAQVGAGLGKAIRNFKDGLADDEDRAGRTDDAAPRDPSAPPAARERLFPRAP